MPSIHLTPDLVSRFICLPGTALIQCSPAELMTESGLLHKPEAAADWERKGMAVRKGVVVALDKWHRGTGIGLRTPEMVHRVKIHAPMSKHNAGWYDTDSATIEKGQTVYYLGRQDEADDPYVVVKIGQIVAVKNEAERSPQQHVQPV